MNLANASSESLIRKQSSAGYMTWLVWVIYIWFFLCISQACSTLRMKEALYRQAYMYIGLFQSQPRKLIWHSWQERDMLSSKGKAGLGLSWKPNILRKFKERNIPASHTDLDAGGSWMSTKRTLGRLKESELKLIIDRDWSLPLLRQPLCVVCGLLRWMYLY